MCGTPRLAQKGVSFGWGNPHCGYVAMTAMYTKREDHEIITLMEFLEISDGRLKEEVSTPKAGSLRLMLEWMLSTSNKREALLRLSLAREVWHLRWNSIQLTSGMRAQNVIVLLVIREDRELWTQRGGVTPLCVVRLLSRGRHRSR